MAGRYGPLLHISTCTRVRAYCDSPTGKGPNARRALQFALQFARSCVVLAIDGPNAVGHDRHQLRRATPTTSAVRTASKRARAQVASMGTDDNFLAVVRGATGTTHVLVLGCPRTKRQHREHAKPARIRRGLWVLWASARTGNHAR